MSIGLSLYDMMCDKDFFNATAKAVLKKEDGNFQFGKANKDYYWLITNMYDATLEIDLIDRDKSILMHVNKNHKSGKDMKFPLTDDFEEDYDEMLDYIFRFLMNEFSAEWYESKKSVKKSLQEGIDIKIVYCDDTPSEYIDDVTMNDIYDILDSSSDICKIVDVSGSKKKVVWTDEYGFERAYESKKSARKSMKESKDTDFFNAMAKKFNFTKDEIKRYKDKTYISVIGILFDRIRSVPTHSDEWYNAMNDCWEGIQTAEDNGFNVDYEKKTYDKIMMTPNYNRESKKSAKKSMKETISKSTWGDWIVDKVERVEGFYNGSPNVRPQLINNLIESIGLNANGHILTFDDIAEEITKGIRAYKLKDLDSWHVHLGHNNDGLRLDLNAKVEHFSEVINHNGKYTVVSVYFYVDEQGTNKEYDFGFVADVLVEINPYIDFVLEESKKSVRKSIKESVKPEIQLMVNNIIDELIGEYSSKEWDRLSDAEKFDIIENKYDFYYEFYFNKKNPKDLLEIEDLVIENMNHPFNIVFESKKSIKESSDIKENIWVWQQAFNHAFNFTNWISKKFTFGNKLHKALEQIFGNREITLNEFVNACIDYFGVGYSDSDFARDLWKYVSTYFSNDKDIETRLTGLSKKFPRKMKESFDSIYATSDMVGKGGKEWLLEGSYNFVMEFLGDWGIAPFSTKTKGDKIYLYDHDGGEYGFYTDEDGALISITDEGTNYAWKNNLNRISTKRVKVYEV